MRGNLPAPLTTFIGRSKDMKRAVEELESGRMVTLLGSGGIGKTRLSIEIARKVAHRFRHGAWQILLDEISDSSAVLEAIGKPFGIVDSADQPLEERLIEFLRDQEMLLVLDNCEQVLEACREAANRILRACPGVKILATSRFVLDAGGECVLRLPSLSHPQLGEGEDCSFAAREAVSQFEAVDLFVQRGRNCDSDFELTTQNLEPVCRITQRLDGIPLAIEIASALLRTLSARQICDQLAVSFDLLNLGRPGVVQRHETVTATIDWSYKLLGEHDQLAFKRLSIIAGPFDLTTAEAVLGHRPLGGMATYEQVARLVDRSLLVSEDLLGEKRFRMLDMTRSFAFEKMRGTDEYEGGQERLLKHFSEFASRWIARMQSGDQQLRLQSEMSAIHNSILSSIEWGLGSEQHIETTGALVRDLFTYWLFLGDLRRGERLIQKVLQGLSSDITPLRIQIMTLAGGAAVYAGRFEGIALIEQAYALAISDTGLPISLVRSWYFSSAYLSGKDELALRLGEEIHEHARREGDKRLEGYSRYFMGHLALEKGDLSTARDHYQELFASKESLGDVRGTAFALCQLAHLDWLEKRGDPWGKFRDGLKRLDECEDISYMADYAALCSEVLIDVHPERAAMLQGWALKVKETSKQKPDRLLALWIDKNLRAAKAKLGESYDSFSEEGRTISTEMIIGLVDGLSDMPQHRT